MEDKTMKKLYVMPNMEIVKIETHSMLAVSIGVNSTGEAVDASQAAGRDFDFDDEEFE